MSGQFYAVYGNTYQCMSTKPMLQQAWETGELIDQLAVMRQAFGYTGLAGPVPLPNQSPPAAAVTAQQPEPKTIQYQPPSFNLSRPTICLTMNERIQVHHNYISAVSNLEHKKDLINRLKRNDPHNIPAYEAEMTCHMTLHEDVLGRILTILKQDDYYRTLEDLPVINSLTTYKDIKLFPKLYDTITIIERVTGEADLIERQLRQPSMYPLHTTPLPSTSGFVPRPTPTFQPIAPAASPEAVNIHHTNGQQHDETSPKSSLPCGQWTPISSTSITSTPSQHTPPQLVVPPKPATPQSHESYNIHSHTQSQKTPQTSPTTQSTQQSPIRTNTNLATHSFIPAAETHQSMSSSPLQHIPKSVNGEGVKSSKPESRSSAPDGRLCFCCKQPGHLKKDCPEQPYCSKCTRGHIPAKYPSKQQGNRSTYEGHEFREEAKGQSHGTRREEWKRAQDQPQFSHKNNRCLHCAGDHQTRDCPMRQHQAPTTSNPANGTGIYTYHNSLSNTSPQQSSPSQPHSQQSQSTVDVTTLTLMVNNPPFQQGLQQQPPAPVPQANQQANY